MVNDWRAAEAAINLIQVKGNESNEQVSIIGQAEGLSCIGIGTDAAVFRYSQAPQYAYKVYSEHAIAKKSTEREVYKRLEGIAYYPKLHGEGRNYLVISYEPGPTLLDCLQEGITVPRQVMKDVEDARQLARERGLNPRDIHLKNVILQDGRAKVLDVSEYVKAGDDNRWEHLAWAYDKFYSNLQGKKIPSWMLDAVKLSYAKLNKANASLEDLGSKAIRALSRFK